MITSPPKIIAEIGCVHAGSMERAKSLIKLAKLAEADYAKFQKRSPYESTPVHMRDKPHPDQTFSYGATYLEHRINLEFSLEQHVELKRYCEEIGIGYSTSVWDVTSAREIIPLSPDFIKIPSACNSNIELMKVLKEEFSGSIHISLGMISIEDRTNLFNFWLDQASRVVFYHCTSIYPCPFENLYLKEIDYIGSIVKPHGFKVGFSNHGYGIAADIAAMILGAEWIERHFVDDRTFRHTDAAASLEPDGLKKLCRDTKNVFKALEYRPNVLDDREAEQMKKLKM